MVRDKRHTVGQASHGGTSVFPLCPKDKTGQASQHGTSVTTWDKRHTAGQAAPPDSGKPSATIDRAAQPSAPIPANVSERRASLSGKPWRPWRTSTAPEASGLSAVRPFRQSIRQAVTPEANAATIDRAATIGKPSASPAPIPASRPPVPRRFRQAVATVRRVPLPACQRFDRSASLSGKPSAPEANAATIDRAGSVRAGLRPMSADLVRRVRNRWPSALLSPQRFDSRPPISRRKRPCKPSAACPVSAPV